MHAARHRAARLGAQGPAPAVAYRTATAGPGGRSRRGRRAQGRTRAGRPCPCPQPFPSPSPHRLPAAAEEQHQGKRGGWWMLPAPGGCCPLQAGLKRRASRPLRSGSTPQLVHPAAALTDPVQRHGGGVREEGAQHRRPCPRLEGGGGATGSSSATCRGAGCSASCRAGHDCRAGANQTSAECAAACWQQRTH